MLDYEFGIRRRQGFPYRISDGSRMAERTRIQRKRARIPTDEKKNY